MSLLLALTGGGGGTSHTLTCDAGAYALSGQDAGFQVGRQFALDAGAYVLAGQDASFSGASVPQVGAGKGGRTLADYEREWQNKPIEALPAKVRRLVKRQAARDVYFAPPVQLPEIAQVYVDRLKAERYAAELAEMRALLDLSSQASAVRAEVARAAVQMARKKQADAAQALEEFDVMYVAAILAEA
jgi:hypothetical protein